MTQEEKAMAIILKIVESCNAGTPIEFSEDFGGNSLTFRAGENHTHFGYPDCDIDTLVDNMYNFMVHGRGLSFAIPLDEPEVKDENSTG